MFDIPGDLPNLKSTGTNAFECQWISTGAAYKLQRGPDFCVSQDSLQQTLKERSQEVFVIIDRPFPIAKNNQKPSGLD